MEENSQIMKHKDDQKLKTPTNFTFLITKTW